MFSRAGVVGQKKAEPRFGKHVEIDGVNLMGKGIDEGDVEGMEGIKLVGELYPVRFETEEYRLRGSGKIQEPFGKDFQGGEVIRREPAFAEVAAGVLSHGFHAPKARSFLGPKDADRFRPKFPPYPHPRLKFSHGFAMLRALKVRKIKRGAIRRPLAIRAFQASSKGRARTGRAWGSSPT